MNKYIPLKELDVYTLARKLSVIAWDVYQRLNWEDKKIMGNQFVTAADSIGANIAEGYGRFHYLDRIKFYYNSRGSYNEFRYHWVELLLEREKIQKNEFVQLDEIGNQFQLKLNNFISSTYRSKTNAQ